MVYPTEKIRLDKLLSQSVSSRRDAKKLIAERRVKVDGSIAEDGGVKVDFSQDVRVDNVRVMKKNNYTYLLFNKPKGVICSRARQSKDSVLIYDLLPYKNKRLFSVGRLDKNTTGLILITDDGDFANRITHPSNKLEKEYILTSTRPLSSNDIDKLKNQPCGKSSRAKYIKMKSKFQVIIIVIEGTKRMIRKMASNSGITVRKLKRIRIGPLKLTGIKPGICRHLKVSEISKLKSF